MVRFILLPLYPWENSLRYPLDMGLGGLHNRSERYGEPGIEHRPLGRAVRNLVYALTEIFWLILFITL
jgi:hypothetical protein